MRNALSALSVALLVGASGALAFTLYHMDRRITHSETLLRDYPMTERTYVKLTHEGRSRVFFQGASETRDEFATRLRRIAQGLDQVDSITYVCTTLVDCEGPVDEIQVCTPCEDPESIECSRSHAEDVAAICRVFHCSNCPE